MALNPSPTVICEMRAGLEVRLLAVRAVPGPDTADANAATADAKSGLRSQASMLLRDSTSSGSTRGPCSVRVRTASAGSLRTSAAARNEIVRGRRRRRGQRGT
jgi:hypothetical protein